MDEAATATIKSIRFLKSGTCVPSEETVTGIPLTDSDPLCDTDEPKDHPLSVPPPPPAHAPVYSEISWQGAIPPASKSSVAYPMILGEQYQASPEMYIPFLDSPPLYSKASQAYTHSECTTKLEQIRRPLEQKGQRELTCEQLAAKLMEGAKKEVQLLTKKQELQFEAIHTSAYFWEILLGGLVKKLSRLDFTSVHFSFLRSLIHNMKAIGFLLVFSLATLVALLRALRSGWGPPLELALSLSNDNYWVVFVDVFADLLAFVWSNPATQYTLCTPLGVTLTISLIMNGIFVYNKIVNGDSTTQNTSFHNKLLLSQEEQCKAAVTSRWELHQALAEVGDWYGLCLGLEISDSISQLLRHSSKDVTDKKRVCLDAFYDLGEGEACWERVVRVVAGYPIHKRGLAKKLAKLVGIDFEDAVGSHSEL